MSNIKIKLLQDDCSAYKIEGKNGSTHEVTPQLAERMVASGHAVIESLISQGIKLTTVKEKK